MGLLTLVDFRDEIDVTFGERSLDTPHYDRWINFAYLDICTAVDFDILDAELSFNTADGTRNYNAPTTPYISIKHVRDTSSDYSLAWIPKEDFFRLTAADEGAPKRWTLHLDDIYLYPCPDGIYAVKAIYKQTPTILSEDGDVTVLQAGWDAAVTMLAVHYGYMALGEEQRAVVWYNRAISYIQSRMTEGGLQKGTPGLLPAFHAGGNYGAANAQGLQG